MELFLMVLGYGFGMLVWIIVGSIIDYYKSKRYIGSKK